MRYIDLIRTMTVHELAVSLKNLTDLMVEDAVKKELKKIGYENIDFKSDSKVSDFEYCLLRAV